MSGVAPGSFSALVVGEGAMPKQCAHMLRRAGHVVVGLVSPDAAVREWAAKIGIPALRPSDDVVAFSRTHGFDYLFSTTNYEVLPGALLASARRLAINYHDGPLPRYAGVYVTSWALMQGEATHGVTWHVMLDEVDAGDILKQVEVAIIDGDTATSLNIRCYQAAIQGFGELVKELAEGRETRTPQDLSKRTYFGFKRRPDNVAVLEWSRPSLELERLVRALTFGNYWNPLTVPKVVLPSGIVAPSWLTRVDASGAAPGTLVDLSAESLRVATADGDVVIAGFRTLAGAPLSNDALGVSANTSLPQPDADALRAAHTLAESLAPHERFWRARLESLPRVSARVDHSVACLEPLPDARVVASRPLDAATWASIVARAAAAEGPTVIGFGSRSVHERLDAAGPLADALFVAWVPMLLDADGDAAREVAVLTKRRTFARDLLARLPVLRDTAPLAEREWLRVVLYVGDDPPSPARRAVGGLGLLAHVTADGSAVEWSVDSRVLPADEARRIVGAVSAAVLAVR